MKWMGLEQRAPPIQFLFERHKSAKLLAAAFTNDFAQNDFPFECIFFIKSVDLKTKDPGNPDSTFSFWIFFLQRVHLGTFKFALFVDWLSK